ncbi:hypothetical protein SDRG_06284 [Saprolegnia diclina VS20]|uniref:Uncharacterized protein n=1 Tax=Saprolegnia diclina (strain VS20) TaxID=1156394 RepID=T0QN78_SAPDV|nr:hypothetical protein SDRG_06284 [Saprolegnia diclina VS20]EQC36171.1 hypothetical protein SDRG_06284 [Saprolegnia diclina VS20]|eukprot:XP_008610277.1 hypothetical protein SDRG_06284 [Saprolegnia diclina VS20]
MDSTRTLSFLQLADADGNNAVTSKEIRALHLHRQLSSADHALQLATSLPKKLSPAVFASITEVQPRHAPWLKKALARMEASQAFWKEREPTPKGTRRKTVPKPSLPAPPPCATIWDAASTGNVSELRRLLEVEKRDVFRHHEADGGRTILHYACWHGHVNIVMYVTMFVQATKGLEALRLFVNCIDSAYSRCTPLLEACRSCQGHLNDKLKIIKLLVLYGATLEHQDAHGDNALHWSARVSSLPIVRYLVKETDAAVFAVITDNYKHEKPLDVAKRMLERKPSMQASEVYDLLRHVYRECNIRLKIQYGKKIRLHQEAERKTKRNDEVVHALDIARVCATRADGFWRSCHEAAESTRNALEAKLLDEAGKEAVGRAQLWLDTKDGKAWAKKELPSALDDLKNLIQDGTLPKPRDMKKVAAVRLGEAYIAVQETDAREQMRKKFMREHPLLESRDVEYYKRLVLAAPH